MSDNEYKAKQHRDKEWFISALRLISTAFIVLCHILQFYGNFLAWWFNVGVQIFFLISGYLHATKSQKPMIPFINKKLLNLLPDYYIYGLAVIAGYSIFLPLSDSVKEIAKIVLITGSTSLSSLAHFWFIPYILFCYLMTPWFNAFLNNCENQRGGKTYLIKIMLLMCIVEVCCVFYFKFIPAWINSYLVGMIMKEFRTMNSRLNKLMALGVFVFMLIFNGFQVWIGYYKDMHFEGVFGSAYNELCHYGHVFLALGIFIVVMQIFSKLNISNTLKKILNISDKYSYDIFLVHPVFIWSGISPLRQINSPWLAIVVLILEIAISALVLNRCASLVKKKI